MKRSSRLPLGNTLPPATLPSHQHHRRGETEDYPTHTGEPSVFYAGTSAHRDYPRAYGGTTALSSFRMKRNGLSPRVRGNHRWSDHHTTDARTIPACTGEPSDNDNSSVFKGDYPRVYGGTFIVIEERKVCNGLSPRVRGNLLSPRFCRYVLRTIPACTGEPVCLRTLISPPTDYPRVYGGTSD